ncbi:MAG TPA: hypothetical protein VFM40_07490 [Actinomycetota bacterium]|nr:hypothetical protein [Actinomycetota bacterium]
MSLLRPRLPRLAFVAMSLILMGTLVAAPSISGAAPNSVKQFIASFDTTEATGGVAGSWTETVTNCGGPSLPPRCTLASTIGLGSIRITVPTDFRPVTVSDNNPNWTTNYSSTTGNITATANAGSSKLQPGQSISITISATPSLCASGPKQFTTAAWGSTAISGTDPFAIQTDQPTVTVATNGACLTSGGSVTDPGTGQTETITGNFQGHVSVTFGGTLDCSFDPTFGTQWSQFNLPTQVNIVPASDFIAGSDPKISTSRFPTEGADSSLYLICYGVPIADHGTFVTRGGDNATAKDLDGDGTNDTWVGILPNCYDPVAGLTRPEPCVSEQFLDLITNQIVISVRMPPADPFKR